MTPSPRPSITSRVLDFLFGKPGTPEERARAKASRPPKWVRLISMSVLVSVMAAFVYTIVGKYGWLSLPWKPAYWPDSIVFYGLIMATVFAEREIGRRYAKRDGRAHQ